jgi:hypothetical protein
MAVARGTAAPGRRTVALVALLVLIGLLGALAGVGAGDPPMPDAERCGSACAERADADDLAGGTEPAALPAAPDGARRRLGWASFAEPAGAGRPRAPWVPRVDARAGADGGTGGHGRPPLPGTPPSTGPSLGTVLRC